MSTGKAKSHSEQRSSIQFIQEHDFIERLAAQVRAGFGLVPFIGSGCSSASGILMGEQFIDYLAWTVHLCVDDESRDLRWNLRRDGWPPLPTGTQVQAARVWALKHFKPLAKNCNLKVTEDRLTSRISEVTPNVEGGSTPETLVGLLYAPLVPPFLRSTSGEPDGSPQADAAGHGKTVAGLRKALRLRQLHALLGSHSMLHGGLVRPEFSPTSQDAIVERAIRSLYDWRSTLHFLAQLQLAEDGRTLFLVEPDPAVIDGFNVHITRGRRPNLTHTMLCHLREPARMRIVLTTNFDTLIEDAFAEQHRRLEVIPVSLKGALPDPEIVHARDTVVKLHGALSETRADFSLDEPPSLDDRRRFFHYVRGGLPEKRTDCFLPGHLLVAGYSGSDVRCVQFMKFVLDSDPEALLFWICHSSRDRDRVEALFPENAYAGRIFATVGERVDLLLYEFYQHLCLSLPPGGSSYQLNHNVPPGASFRPEKSEDEEAAPGAAEIMAETEWLKPVEAANSQPKPRLLVVDGPSGVLAALRSAFNTLAREYGLQKLWLELEDYGDSGGVAHELFQIIAIRRGLFQLGHAQLCPADLCKPIDPGEDKRQAEKKFDDRVAEWRDHIGLLCEHLGIEPNQWLVVLYGRNGPGGCSGWNEHAFWDGDPADGPGPEYGSLSPHGKLKGSYQPSTFAALLRALVDQGFTVLYAPYSKTRQDRDNDRRNELRNLLSQWTPPSDQTQMSKIADRVVGRHFVFPRAAHTKEHLESWLGPLDDENRNERWRWVTLPTRIMPLANEDSGFGRTMRYVLYGALRLHWPDSEPTSGELAQPRSRFNLLFGASLFRQSRHYTALLSEGVFRCPQRFNSYGFDNDVLRYRELERWLQQLNRMPRVFYRKPGGFAWLYRDVRLGLRCLTLAISEAVAEADAAPGGGHGPAGRLPLAPCEWLLARTHFWIGDWYHRAYHVTGHAGPLMEAAYHFYQCVCHAPKAQTRNKSIGGEQLWAYRLLWWRLGLTQLIKTLRLGASALRFWFGPRQNERWFGQSICRDVEKKVEEAFEQLKLVAEPEDPVPPEEWARAHAEADALRRVLRAEFFQLSERNTNQLRVRSYNSLRGTLDAREEQATDFSRIELPALEAIEFDESGPDWWKELPQAPPITELFDKTGDLFGKEGKPPDWKGLTKYQLEQFRGDPAYAAAMLQHLVEWSFLLLRRAKHEEHAVPLEDPNAVDDSKEETDWKTVPTWSENPEVWGDTKAVPAEFRVLVTPPEVRAEWVRTCVFASTALDAQHWLPPGLDDFGAREASKALGIYGLALARLHRFREAHRRFNHAHALLSKSGGPAPLVLFGILELRRAEAHLLEANLARELADLLARHGWEKEHCRGLNREELENAFRRAVPSGTARQRSLSDWLREHLNPVSHERGSALWHWLEAQIAALDRPREAREETVDDRLRRLTASRCDDAWSALEHAETLLGGRTHSPRWWGRLRALQLRALATTPRTEFRTDPLAPEGSRTRLLTHRVRREQRTNLNTLWREGRAAAPDDNYNRLRVLDYYVRALLTANCATDEDRASITEELARLKERLMIGLGAKIDAKLAKLRPAAEIAPSAEEVRLKDWRLNPLRYSLEFRYLANVRCRAKQPEIGLR